jgi:hypothetical protein
LSDLHHVEILECWTILDAELEVPLLVSDRISIESKLRQLMSILDRLDVVKLFNPIIREEDSLESWAVIETLNRFNQVSTQVHFCEGNQTIETFNMGN